MELPKELVYDVLGYLEARVRREIAEDALEEDDRAEAEDSLAYAKIARPENAIKELLRFLKQFEEC